MSVSCWAKRRTGVKLSRSWQLAGAQLAFLVTSPRAGLSRLQSLLDPDSRRAARVEPHGVLLWTASFAAGPQRGRLVREHHRCLLFQDMPFQWGVPQVLSWVGNLLALSPGSA